MHRGIGCSAACACARSPTRHALTTWRPPPAPRPTPAPAPIVRRRPIPHPLPPEYGPNAAGYLAIFTLTVSLISSTFFSEAVWQRVWASCSRRALYGGAALGCATIVLVVFLSGFGGWLAFVGGLAEYGVTNPNVYLMQVRVTDDWAAACGH